MLKILLLLVLIVNLSFANIIFSSQEKEWIKNNPTINVGGEMDWTPFDFVDKNGQYSGITKEYLDLISQKSGLKFNVITGYTWNELIENFKNKKFDLLPAVYYSQDREEFGIYTSQYYTVRDYLFVKDSSTIRSLQDLNGKVLAIPKGYSSIPRIKKTYPKIKILETRSIVDSIASVLSGEADATIEVYAVMSYTIKSNAIEGLKVVSQEGLGTYALHMLIQKDKEILQSIINKSLADITIQEQNKIVDQWLVISKDTINKNQIILGISIFVIIIIFFALKYYISQKQNQLLEQKVKERTKELEEFAHTLEQKVKERTKELEDVNDNLEQFINTQDNIVILADGEKATFANQKFFDFLGYENLESFQVMHSCICEKFIENERFFHLGKIKDGQNWIQAIQEFKPSERIVSIMGPDFHVHALSVAINDFNDKLKIISFTDISHTMIEQIRLEEKTILDKLTGSFNREYFEQNYKNLLNEYIKSGYLFGLALLDIDHFKIVNDTYGHDVGDDVLKHFVNTVQNYSRNDDIFIRWGGEEFIMILKVKSKEDLQKALEHIRQVLELENFPTVGQKTCSIGGTIYQDNEDIEKTIKRADEAVYEAKAGGRNRVIIKT